MLRLPVVTVNGVELRLPLSLAAGASLAATLAECEPGDDRPKESLVTLLREEPILLAWAGAELTRPACHYETISLEGVAAILPLLLYGAGNIWSAASLGRKSATWQVFTRQARAVNDDLPRMHALLVSFAPKLSEAKTAWKQQVKNADPATTSLARLLSALPRRVDLQVPESARSLQPLDLQELEAAKQQALYYFAYGLSHEINNPLANISLRAQTLQADEPNPERRRKLAVIQTQATRAYEMLADLMLYAHPPALQTASMDLAPLVREVVESWHDRVREQSTALQLEGLPEVTIQADPVHLRSVLNSLLQNALEAVQSGGNVVVGGENSSAEVQVFVRDTGPGISDEILPHVFDPFYSGREAGRGLGLGLSKCWRIVQLHGGRINIVSPPRGGAEFRIVLPLTKSSQ